MILIILLLSSSALAADPTTICQENAACTPPMLSIVNGYREGNANFAQLPLVGFSGGCYYISSLYSSEHQHHGAFIFERIREEILTAGEFSFFTSEDPYRSMNSAELKKFFVGNGSRFSNAIQSVGEIELRYITDQSDFHYWFRSNLQKNKLFVIGEQFAAGKSASVFCEMNAR